MSIWLPSKPTQLKVEWGKLLLRDERRGQGVFVKRPKMKLAHMLFQDNFCVKKLSHPDNLAI